MPNIRPRVFANQAVSVEVTSPLDDFIPEAPTEFRDEMPVLGTVESKVVDAEIYETVTLRIPQVVYAEYQQVAHAQDMSVEELMQHRLLACKSHSALRGLWFSDSERAQLENHIQKWPLETAAQALSLLAKAGTVNFDEIKIVLTAAQRRVLGFAMFGGRTPESFFKAMVQKELRA